MIGEAGMTTALHEIVCFVMTESDPDYVVLGETRNYSFEQITKAIRLIGVRRPVHCDEPGCDGAERRTARCRPRASVAALITTRHRQGALRRRQAEPHDVPFSAQPDRARTPRPPP